MQNIKNHASMFRRGAAMVYDGLLSFAVLVVASAIFLPFAGDSKHVEFNIIRTVYFVGVMYLFFGWFWTHGGQTLGMRAWRIKLTKLNGEIIDWPTAAVRYLISMPMWFYWFCVIYAAQGYNTIPYLSGLPVWLLYSSAVAWTLFDHLPNNWRDRLSRTRISYHETSASQD